MKADLLVLNARIHTLDDQCTIADSLAALNGRVLAVGPSEKLNALAGPNTVVFDLSGRTVLPGFIDAHEHLSWFAEEPLKLNVSPTHVGSLSDLTHLVSKETERLRRGEWVRG